MSFSESSCLVQTFLSKIPGPASDVTLLVFSIDCRIVQALSIELFGGVPCEIWMYFHAVGDPKIAFSSQNQETKTTPKVTLRAFPIDCRIVQALATQLFWGIPCQISVYFHALGDPKTAFSLWFPENQNNTETEWECPLSREPFLEPCADFGSPMSHLWILRGFKTAPKSNHCLKMTTIYPSKWSLGDRIEKTRIFLRGFFGIACFLKGKNLPKCGTVVAKLSFS